ncbi:hypothetical protein BDN67DRAFT_219699 [Paxillus ammoniavirescens]|nr:hypothetical protein BDN67DRAFT_219699 [Paxillus ammoniavirescens]
MCFPVREPAMRSPGLATPLVQPFHPISTLPQTDLASIGDCSAGSLRSVSPGDSLKKATGYCSMFSGDSSRNYRTEDATEEKMGLDDFVMVVLGPHDLPFTWDDPPSAVPPVTRSFPFQGGKLKRPRCAEDEDLPPPPKKRRAVAFRLFDNDIVFPAWIPEVITRPLINATQPKQPSVAEGHGVDGSAGNQDDDNRKNDHRLSLASIPDSVDGCSYWLTRSLKKPWTLRHFSTPLSYTNRPEAPGHPQQRPSSVYASCFVSGHMSHPSVIRWKSG